MLSLDKIQTGQIDKFEFFSAVVLNDRDKF